MTASHPLPRRRLLRGLVAGMLALPLALGACGGEESSDDGKVELSFFWWGAEARAQLTEQALALYTTKHPEVTFKKTWQANQGYFDKLATLTAGNDAPDIFQIDDNYLAEYATRNVTQDLTEYQKSGKIDTSKFPQGLVTYATVDGKLAGLPIGENTQGLVFNKTKLEAAKVPLPTTGQTWEEHIAWAKDAAAKTGVAGTQDPSADYKAFWVWLRQNGKEFYNGSQLGFTQADVQAWFELWKGARDAKATPTPDVIHEGNATDVSKQLVVTGKALTSWVWANQMPELQKNTKDALEVIAYPGDASKQWPRASMYFSVYKGSEHKDVAADVLNFLANDPEAGKILGTDRGIPANTEIRAQVAATTENPSMKQTIAVVQELAKNFGPAPAVPPKGHSTVRSELIKAAEEAQYGRATPAKAAEQFFAAAQAAISR
ncbi:sugar ABC transporter substrate-binding protein [Actinoplanes lobatus]|uniref:Multiple sugar transport system substrate-binding protein n=1 Tax=Actinoplanes lobatus TaxID=113568 RepID=A0A7W7HQJ8_9ACTN|nr:extracellular solute-binding protein [Actinoplanes lobatus]MBB4754782.1 multiple sugar transport system substrate-binding protein [Actinoplanes lobatus]GGN81801.1 sugar ABC transporter substrate-binding protein [Actinoplanes lobatus]GIE43085.1 sugar ABC transporter substrate-binding protein [Actinoplanes lobatus]